MASGKARRVRRRRRLGPAVRLVAGRVAGGEALGAQGEGRGSRRCCWGGWRPSWVGRGAAIHGAEEAGGKSYPTFFRYAATVCFTISLSRRSVSSESCGELLRKTSSRTRRPSALATSLTRARSADAYSVAS